ncbi:hypothetical protein F4X33_01510 [Candidatus Poribacteria bacterium]|nr:hypothetical protein [Candidatus Poribacteria bacterium]
MERKFLVFSCFVLLSSIVYFIYTSYQLHIENKNRQEVEADPKAPLIGSREANGSFQPLALEYSNPEPTKKGWEVSDKTSESTKFEDTEVVFDIEDFEELETKTAEEQSQPELETLFTDVKQLYDQRETIYQETAPFSIELHKLKYRQIEIGLYDLVEASGAETEQLHEEFRRSQDRMQELRTIIAALDDQRLQLEKKVEQIVFDYGMTVEEFDEIYGEKY